MMKTLLILFSMNFVLLPANAQTLTSWMRGEAKNGHILSLKYAGPATWVLSDFAPCLKYPCRVKDQTTETRLSARWISSPTVADGNIVIGLSNGMAVKFVNNALAGPISDGTRVQSYWQLERPLTDGSPSENVRMLFLPSVE